MAEIDPLTHGANKTWTPITPSPIAARLLLTGFDSLELNVDIAISPSWQQMLDRILSQRRELRRKWNDSGDIDDLTCLPLTVYRTSAFQRLPIEVSDGQVTLAFSPKRYQGWDDGFPETVKGHLRIQGRIVPDRGLHGAYAMGAALVERLGGVIKNHFVSRVDLYADFHIPSGLSLDFIQRHMVRSAKSKPGPVFSPNLELETFYAEALFTRTPRKDRERPYIRIYNKSVDVVEKPDGAWVTDLWSDLPEGNVWRVEYEMYRAFLRKTTIDVHTIEDLEQHAALLWKYATHRTFSLRADNSRRNDRRWIIPLWKTVQNAREGFAVPGARTAFRTSLGKPANHQKLVASASGMLASFARLEGLHDPEEAIRLFADAIRQYQTPERFYKKLATKKC